MNRIDRLNKRAVSLIALFLLAALTSFADKLERASLDTIRSGVMTGDLAGLVEGERPAPVTSEAFLKAIRTRMEA